MNAIVSAVDFERVLKTHSAARTPHFAIHHVSARPARRKPQLSTALGTSCDLPVDDLPPDAVWLGLVVPKRHARRSVTRSLLKRQIRAAAGRWPNLGHGLWVVRLRNGFDRKLFPSAASPALAALARVELDGLFERAAARTAAPMAGQT